MPRNNIIRSRPVALFGLSDFIIVVMSSEGVVGALTFFHFNVFFKKGLTCLASASYRL